MWFAGDCSCVAYRIMRATKLTGSCMLPNFSFSSHLSCEVFHYFWMVSRNFRKYMVWLLFILRYQWLQDTPFSSCVAVRFTKVAEPWKARPGLLVSGLVFPWSFLAANVRRTYSFCSIHWSGRGLSRAAGVAVDCSRVAYGYMSAACFRWILRSIRPVFRCSCSQLRSKLTMNCMNEECAVIAVWSMRKWLASAHQKWYE